MAYQDDLWADYKKKYPSNSQSGIRASAAYNREVANPVISAGLAGEISPEDFARGFVETGPGAEKHVRAGQGEAAVFGTMSEAMRLRDEGDRRYEEGVSGLEGAYEESKGSPLTDQNIQDLYARETDAAADGSMSDTSYLRGMLGGAGVTGGGSAAALGARVQLNRMRQVTGAKRDLRVEKAYMDAEQRVREYQNALSLANVKMQGPDDTLLGALGGLASMRKDEAGQAAAMEEAGRASKNAMIGGALSGVSGLLGGFIPMLGGSSNREY